MDWQSGARRAAKAESLGVIFIEELNEAASGLRGLVGGFAHAANEEGNPRLPVALFACRVQEPVIFLTMRLQVEASAK